MRDCLLIRQQTALDTEERGHEQDLERENGRAEDQIQNMEQDWPRRPGPSPALRKWTGMTGGLLGTK